MSAPSAVGMEGDTVTDMVSHFYPNSLRLVPPSCANADLAVSPLLPFTCLLPTPTHNITQNIQQTSSNSAPTIPARSPLRPPRSFSRPGHNPHNQPNDPGAGSGAGPDMPQVQSRSFGSFSNLLDALHRDSAHSDDSATLVLTPHTPPPEGSYTSSTASYNNYETAEEGEDETPTMKTKAVQEVEVEEVMGVQEEVKEVKQKPVSKRTHALLELLNSERAYASDLALIRDVHIPLALGESFSYFLLLFPFVFSSILSFSWSPLAVCGFGVGLPRSGAWEVARALHRATELVICLRMGTVILCPASSVRRMIGMPEVKSGVTPCLFVHLSYLFCSGVCRFVSAMGDSVYYSWRRSSFESVGFIQCSLSGECGFGSGSATPCSIAYCPLAHWCSYTLHSLSAISTMHKCYGRVGLLFVDALECRVC